MKSILEWVSTNRELTLCLFTTVILLYGAGSWCSFDARQRGKSPIFVFLACVMFFPWGWIAWLIFRPDVIDSERGWKK